MEINGVEITKPVSEMTDAEIGGIIEDWGEINDSFIGYKINEAKKETLNKMVSLCNEASRLDKTITFSPAPFGNRNRHAMMQLIFPVAYVADDARINRTLSELFSLTSFFSVAASEDEKEIRISFFVADMWETHGEVVTNHYKIP